MVRNEEIAKAAGVSAVTVSRVLNNAPNVASATREAVLKAARELGKTVSSDLTRRKVLVLSLFSGLELNEPLTRAAEEFNVSLLFKNFYQQDLTLETVLRDSAVDGEFDGALLVDCDIGPAAQLAEVTAVAQPLDGIARNALFLLASRMDGRLKVEESIQLRLRPRLEIRSSTQNPTEEE